MTNDIRATMTRLYREALNTGNLDLIDELVDENVVEHEELPGIAPDREGVKQFFGMIHEAFDGFHIDVEDMIVEGDKGVARGTMRGKHIGEFMGIPAAEKQIEVLVVDIFPVCRWQGGRALGGHRRDGDDAADRRDPQVAGRGRRGDRAEPGKPGLRSTLGRPARGCERLRQMMPVRACATTLGESRRRFAPKAALTACATASMQSEIRPH